MVTRISDWLWDLQGLTCREAARLAAKAMEVPLAFRERAALFLHGMLCSYCRNYRRQLRLIRRLMRRMGKADSVVEDATLPPECAHRIKEKLKDGGDTR